MTRLFYSLAFVVLAVGGYAYMSSQSISVQPYRSDKAVLHPTIAQRPTLTLTFSGRIQHVVTTLGKTSQGADEFPLQQNLAPGLMTFFLSRRQGGSCCLTLVGNPGETVGVTGLVENHQEWGKSNPVTTKVKFDKSGEANLVVVVGSGYKDHVQFE